MEITHNDHSDEARDEAWNLRQSLYDDERAREVDERREGVVGDDLESESEGNEFGELVLRRPRSSSEAAGFIPPSPYMTSRPSVRP